MEIQEPRCVIIINNIEYFELPLKDFNKEEIMYRLEHGASISGPWPDPKEEIHNDPIKGVFEGPLMEDIVEDPPHITITRKH